MNIVIAVVSMDSINVSATSLLSAGCKKKIIVRIIRWFLVQMKNLEFAFEIN